jgi:hypothetical protein
MWLVPEGAQVIEFQDDDKPTNYAATLSAACGHMHTIIPLTKMLEENKKTTICSSVLSVLTSITAIDSAKPVVKQSVGLTSIHSYGGLKFETLFSLARENTEKRNDAQTVH